MQTRVGEYSNEQVRAYRDAFRKLDRDLQNRLRREQRKAVAPIWRQEVRAAASNVSTMAERTFGTGNSVQTGHVISLKASGSAKTVGADGHPVKLRQIMYAVEFGSVYTAKTKYNATSDRGKRYTVNRRARAAFMQPRKTGYVVLPASRLAIPRVIKLNVQTTVRALHEAVESASR